jgi:hypothetical protein
MLKEIVNNLKIASQFNREVINFGLNTHEYCLEEQMKPFVSFPEDENTIIFVRTNHRTDEIEILYKFKIFNGTVTEN